MLKVKIWNKIFIKKIIALFIIVTNLSFTIPIASFAADTESENDNDEKYPALVDVAADSIISKFVNTDTFGGSSSSTGTSGGIITSYEETGDGWLSVTEVKYPNGTTRKYRNYQQGISSFCTYWDKPFWGGNMQNSGCGPTAAAIVLSGYGYDAGPYDVVNAMETKTGGSFSYLRQAMKDIGNIEAEDHYGKGQSSDIQIIRDNFKKGRPVIVNAPNHYIVLLGEDSNGKLIVSDPGSKFYVSKGYENIGPSVPGSPDNLEDFVNKGMITCGYILITSDGNASTNNSNSSNTSKNESNKKSEQKSDNKKATSTASGKAKTEKCDPYNGGYEAIFTSGTTGRQFKEYRQNLDGWNSRYNISGVGCKWTSECGLVSCMIVGSGYSKDANFENATSILVNELGGSTVHSVFLSRWISGQSTSYRGYYNKDEMISNLKKGCVGILRLGTRSSWGQHYVTVLDYDDSTGKVYISNPWRNGFPVGWSDPSNLTGQMGVLSVDDMIFFSNDGSAVDYSGSGNTVKNIAEDKIFYIGDSWIELLKTSGVAKSSGSYFYGKSGMNADWVLNTYSSMNIPKDASCIVVKFGLNGPSLWKKTQELVDKLSKDYPDKDIFVLQSPHVCKEYSYGNTLTGDTLNKQVDTYNKNMKEYCEGKSGVTYIDPTINIVSESGSGYLKKEYASGTFHLNSNGNKVWYEDIIKCIKNYVDTFNRNNNNSSVDMSANIVPRDENNLSKGYKINIDLDQEIDDMLENLEKCDFNMSNYLSSKNNHEYLKNMIKACIVTQYPDLRSAREIADKNKEKDPNEVQGCVKFKRYVDDKTEDYITKSNLNNPWDSEENGGGMYLEYMPLEDLKQMINDGDKKALNYFSMDSSNNIVVAGWETMDVSINIQQTNIGEVGACPSSVYGEVQYTPKAQNYEKLTTKTINYLDQISNYTLPFSLFWSLLVYGHDQEFINDFAKLVISTDIVIGCFDAVKTTTTTYTDTDTKAGVASIDNYKNVDSSDIGRDSGKVGETQVVTVEYNFLITETDTLQTDNPSLKIKYANIWTAVYNKEYIIETKETQEKGDKVELDDITNNTSNYQKIKREDGTFGYSSTGKPEDDNLLNKVDESIDSVYEENKKIFEKELEEKNKQFEYRYTNLSNYLYDYNIVLEENGDIYDFFMLREVQNQIINCVINIASDDYISNIFDPGSQVNGNTKEYDDMLYYANQINSNNSEGILKDANKIIKNLINEHVRNKGGIDSELYKLLTKNGTDTKMNYTLQNMQSSQIEVKLMDTERTEEYEKNIEDEQIKEVPKDDNLRWKIDKNAKENSFVKLLAHSKSAKGNLRIIGVWFFDSLEETAAIADMEDLLKYLFQKVYGTNYGITDEDADKILKEWFDPANMKKFSKRKSKYGNIVGGASYSSITLTNEELQILYKLVQAENSTNPTWTACTVLNRILSSAFPNTMREVVFASNQFEVTWTGAYDAAVPTQDTIDAINEVLKTGDVSGGSIGFQTIELYDSQYPNQTWETPIETLREDYGWGGSSVYFTTASIQAELAQYK